MKLIERLRHRHGFGVHSPLAFEGVKRVISPGKTAYYGYQDIDFELERNLNRMPARLLYRWRADARLLLRFCVWMKPSSIWLWPEAPELIRTAVKAYDSRLQTLTGKEGHRAQLVVCSGNTVQSYHDIILSAIQKEDGMAVIFDYDEKKASRMFGMLQQGLMLYSKRWVILMNRKSMQPISYRF